MALPVAKRPEEVQEAMEEVAATSSKIKISFRKVDLFMDCMGLWYAKLPEKARNTLTKKRFLRRVLSQCHELEIQLAKLPKDWFKKVVTTHGIVLYKKIIKNEREHKAQARMKLEMKMRQIFGLGSSDKDKKEAEVKDDNPDPEPELAEQGPNGLPLPKPKKWVDLTNEPPPEWWIQEYAKGVVHRRHLEICSTHDQNILFYDYEPPTNEMPPEMKNYGVKPHDKLMNFDWWNKEMEVAKKKAEWKHAHKNRHLL